MSAAPLVHVPVVVGLDHDEVDVAVGSLAQDLAGEAGPVREVEPGELTARGHVADSLVHEITPARWTSEVEDEFHTVLRINVHRRKGIMAEIAAEISSRDAGVESINIEERNAEISTINVGITVRNRDHLAKIMRRLRRISTVINVARRTS